MKTKNLLLAILLMFVVMLFSVAISPAQGTWTKKADFPGAARYGAASFSIGNKAYLGIGRGDNGYLKDFWEYDQATAVWTRKADYPGNSGSGAVCFSIGTKGYIGTGFAKNSNGSTNEFWEYDPSSDTWNQKASLPGADGRFGAIGFSIGTKGYIGLGGIRGMDVITLYQDFWEWDQTTNAWTQKPDFVGAGRYQAISFSIGNNGYIGTGNYGTNMGSEYDMGLQYNDFWEWNQITNHWTQKANIPGEARGEAVGFSIGNKGYIGLGLRAEFNALNDFWEWNQGTNLWSQKAKYAGLGKIGAVGFSIGNKGYIGTGYGDSNGSILYKDFWEFYSLEKPDSLTDIIPDGSTVKKLSTNQFQFLEGPVWYNDSVLLFDDNAVSGMNIHQYNPVTQQFSKWPISAECNGLTCDKDRNLIACSWNIIMMNKAGQVIKTLASQYNAKSFNNLNDLIADNKGGVYFSDPDFFLTTRPQDKTAVYYINSTGNVKRVIDDLAEPNGLVLSPGGTKLYVVDSSNKYVYSWDVATDGSVSGKLNLAELQTTGGVASGADGMAIDNKGNIYVATEIGIQIYSAKGVAITTIEVPEIPSNCDFGGKDFKTLYITARKNLYSIDLNYPGFAVSRILTTDVKNSISNKSLIKIYPNPVQNVLHINLSGKTGMLEAFDITGKSVLEKEIRENNTSIDVSGLVNGIYLLKIWSDNQLFTRKFVKF